MNSSGQTVKGTVDAESSEEAVSKIRSMGNFPTKLKERAAKGRAKAAATPGGKQAAARTSRRKAGKVPAKKLTQFTRQLSTLQDAGLPLLRSLRILEEQQKPGMMRVAIRLVADDVEAGTSLSESMGKHPKAFARLYVSMVRAGELGGVLDLILQRLADFMERAQALKRKVIGAMIYPAVVITFAFLIVTALLIWVVPKFKDIFAELGTELPAMTQMLLNLSDFMKNYGAVAIIGSVVGLIVVLKLLKKSRGGALLVDKLKLSIPIMGGIIGKTCIARFTRTLGTLLSAGVPILEALSTTADTAGNEVYERTLHKIRSGIREGDSIAKPLRQTRTVDSMVVNMIDVGEETGELDKMLERIANTYEEEVDTAVSSLVALLEPVMIIVLGGIVAFIVLALFMPMVGMLEAVQKQ
jgi:type IV pilus assembly protein PilC